MSSTSHTVKNVVIAGLVLLLIGVSTALGYYLYTHHKAVPFLEQVKTLDTPVAKLAAATAAKAVTNPNIVLPTPTVVGDEGSEEFQKGQDDVLGRMFNDVEGMAMHH